MTQQWLKIRNFEKYQHYKQRKPPWIKLYFSILADPDFSQLPEATKMHIIGIMLLASQHDNKLPFQKQWIERAIFSNQPIDWKAVLSSGFVVVYEDASRLLALDASKLHQNPPSETETETETEEEKAGAAPEGACPTSFGFIGIPLKDGSVFMVQINDITEWSKLYPDISVGMEVKAYYAWTMANPAKRKTARGIRKSIHHWLAGEQRKASDKSKPTDPGKGTYVGQPPPGIKGTLTLEEKRKLVAANGGNPDLVIE